MAYTTAEGRERILEDLARAVELVADALASIGVAYERLDEQHADALEERLFRPVQSAYGRAQRTHSEFAARSGLPGSAFVPHSPPAPSHPVRELIDRAAEDVRGADDAIGALQDSMLPVEVGDPELRAGLSEVRELLAPVPGRARELNRTVGR
ncbi:MAG: hypothetical protein ACRDNJ_11800 [Solirubrobacteraceae bacterium]